VEVARADRLMEPNCQMAFPNLSSTCRAASVIVNVAVAVINMFGFPKPGIRNEDGDERDV